jgi:hypothetical protein
MTRMKKGRVLACVFLCVLIVAVSLEVKLEAQNATRGSIEFRARIQPTGGRMEPARSIPFLLLSKSLVEIRKEVEAATSPTDLDAFITSLAVSDELKAWMKKNNTVQLAGTVFTKLLKADDITGVPEFLEAYMKHNGASLNAGLPAPKFKESDRVANPDKYKRERDEYLKEVKRYIEIRPESMHGIDAALGDRNPTLQWMRRQNEQQREIERRTLAMAQTTYLAAQTESDVEGRAAIAGLAPGNYWITNLDTPALAGDVRLFWDVPVQVISGETARIELSNLNALTPTGRTRR